VSWFGIKNVSMISNLAISTDLFLRKFITAPSTNYVVHGV